MSSGPVSVRRGAILAILLAICLIATGLSMADVASAKRPIYVPDAPRERQLPHEDLHLGSPALLAPAPHRTGSGQRLPEAAREEVHLAAGARERVPGLPVTVGVVAGQGERTLDVSLPGRVEAQKAGFAGVLVRVRDHDGRGSQVNLTLDYSGFAKAGSADWVNRLRLVTVPACLLSTPNRPACRVQTPVAYHNDPATETISGRVSLAATSDGVMLAAAPAPSGTNGDFTASSLSPSGSWSQAGATGGFSWSYPLTLPPAATGTTIAPTATLSYSSQSVDGQNSTTNNQSSWVGEGWSYDAGYVERTFRTCADDKNLTSAQQTQDQCWESDIVTLSMPGGSTAALVRDDATGQWHPATDNGDKVERMTGADNGVQDGEYWVVTTRDGTKYTFGLNRLPGSTASDATDSVWGVPVFNHTGSGPCSDQPDHRCRMGSRWNLDMVQDVHGNATVYSYVKEQNYYNSEGAGGARLVYDRGGYLKKIDYGLSTAVPAGLFGSPAPQQIDFAVAERCFPGALQCTDDNFTIANADMWPDTPVDLACDASGPCDTHAPTYWTRKRLTQVTTSYYGAGTYHKVDEYALTQTFHNTGDDQLVLDALTRTGWDGPDSIQAPPVLFGMDERPNRVPGLNNLPDMLSQRLTNITTETGQVVSISYSGDAGQAGRTKPMCTATVAGNITPQSNGELCYPVKWTPPYAQDPILDYFNKYVVTEVNVQDRNGTAPNRITTYTYVGDPAWHYDDNEVMKPRFRQWGQFRGYSQVDVRTGNPNSASNGQPDAWTLARNYYFRGMDGDNLPNDGHRSVTLTDSQGGTYTDEDSFSGQVLETQNFKADGGSLIAKTINRPRLIGVTATRARTGLDPLKATIVRPQTSTTFTTKAAGGFITATVATTYDAVGRPTEVINSATGAKTNCVKTTYADNDATGVHDKASEVITYDLTCPTTATPSPTIMRDARTYYDGNSVLGVVGIGDATRAERAKSGTAGNLTWVASTTGYDQFGRVTTNTVENPGATPAIRTTSTDYTPSGVGALTKVVTTLPLSSHVTTSHVDPGRGFTYKHVDVGDLVTEGSFDPLGRLTAVWRPGQVKGIDPATEKYTYELGPSAPLAVTTQTLVDPGNGAALSYRTKVAIFDAFGSVRQGQADAVGGGMVVTDNFQDSHGWTTKTYDHWFTTGSPSITIVQTAESGIDDWKTTTYDGAGRPTAMTGHKGITDTATTKTIYGGDRVTTIPPTGGITTTSITDGRGQKTELWQYKTAPTISGDVVSGGTAQKISYTWDSVGQQTQQQTAVGTSKVATWTNTYDLLGEVTSAVSPDSGNQRSTYYNTGELKTRTDGANRVIAYDYDALGRQLDRYSGSVGGTKLATWSYDTKMLGQLDSSSSIEKGATYTTEVAGYDTAGRPLGSKITLAETGFNTSYETAQTWTKTGLPATNTMAASTNTSGGGMPAETLTYSYDSLGNAAGMSGINAYVSGATYTPYGEPSQYVLGVNDQTATVNYDRNPQTRQITDITLTGQTATPQIDRLQYTFDPAGNLTKSVETQGGAATGPKQTQCFAYDALRQLKDAWSSTDSCATNPSTLGNNSKVGGPQPYWTTWSFDDAGGRLTQVKHAATGGLASTSTTTDATADIAHPHALTGTTTKVGTSTTATGTYAYNADGAMKTKSVTVGSTTTSTAFAYGTDGSLDTVTTAGKTSTYIQDADGSMLVRKDPTSTTLFLPGQEISVSSTGVVTVNRYYSFNGTNVGIRVNKGSVKYLLANQNGTNQVSVDPANSWAISRRWFDPYGNPLGTAQGAAFPGNHKFMNQPANATTGLTDMGARQYDPTIERFTSVDPVLSPDDLQAANGYRYADNNPITFTDASGLMARVEGGGSSTSTTPLEEEYTPPPSFGDGFADGAGEGAREVLDSLNPESIIEGIKNMILNPPNPWSFIKTVVSGITHFDDLKGIYDAWQNGDDYGAGYHLAKFLVEVGGDLAATILGATVASKLSDALRAGSEAAAAVSTADTVVQKAADIGSSLPEVSVDALRFPESAAHAADTIGGDSAVYTIDRAGASARRAASMRGQARIPGMDRDEWPPALFQEGGDGASVRGVTPSDNRGAGASIGNQCRGLPDGTAVRVRIC